jgi:hypothetical protein
LLHGCLFRVFGLAPRSAEMGRAQAPRHHLGKKAKLFSAQPDVNQNAMCGRAIAV